MFKLGFQLGKWIEVRNCQVWSVRFTEQPLKAIFSCSATSAVSACTLQQKISAFARNFLPFSFIASNIWVFVDSDMRTYLITTGVTLCHGGVREPRCRHREQADRQSIEKGLFIFQNQSPFKKAGNYRTKLNEKLTQQETNLWEKLNQTQYRKISKSTTTLNWAQKVILQKL